MKPSKAKPYALDSTSARIIEALQKDGRRPYSSLGKDVGLSEAAARNRVQRLIEDGVMEIVAVTDAMHLGFDRQALVGIRVSGAMTPIAEAVAELDEVVYLVLVSGQFDILAEIVCETDEHMLDVLERIRSIEGVFLTESLVYLQIRKQTYDEGVRLPG